MTALLTAEKLSVTFRVAGGLVRLMRPSAPARLTVLDDVSFALQRGETMGLVGESGSGKTTLARALIGLLPIASGLIIFDGQDLKTPGDFRSVRRSVAMMFQDPVASLSPRLKIGSLLTEPFVIHGADMPDRRERAKELLALVGLPASFADRFPHELSGGQARRIGVARALALRPALVIADEPTAGLDVSIQGDVLNLMTGLKRELGLSYIIVTHNLAMVRHVSDRLGIMYLGRLVETGPTQDVFRNPLHPYTRTLIESEPLPDPRRRRSDLAIKGEIPSIVNRPQGCEFHTRCPVAQARCRAETPVLVAHTGERQVRCHFPLAEVAAIRLTKQRKAGRKS
jgi:peptide/nickel transport system ATP-binding protein